MPRRSSRNDSPLYGNLVNESSSQPSRRWFSILGFQFSRRQAILGIKLFAAGIVALILVFCVWYMPPRATSRSIRSVGGHVQYQQERIPNFFLARILHGPSRMFFTPTDEDIDHVQLMNANVADTWLHRLQPLNSLYHLDIHERQLGAGLKDLDELPRLSTITVWYLCTGDLGQLALLPNIANVTVVQTKCEADLNPLARLPKLSSLNIVSSTVTAKQMEQISQIKTLNALWMGSAKTEGLQPDDLSHLSKCRLHHLQINHITDEMVAALANCKSLETLHSSGSKLTDKGAAALANLPLRHLQLLTSENPIDIEALRSAMPGCRIDYSVQTPSRR